MLRYRARGSRWAEANDRLKIRLRELAEERRRWGYRRLHVLLRREGWTVNRKRVYRIYVEEKLMVRRRKRRRRICAQARVLLAAPMQANETWTMDFLQDALASGRKLRTLSIEDAYTREMLAIEVDTSLPSLRVLRVLEKLRQHRALPVASSSTMARNSLPRRSTSGPMKTKSLCISSRQAGRWRTATSRASMESSARNA
jgi:putative transposase